MGATGDPQRNASRKKGEGVVWGAMSIFPDPLLPRRPTAGCRRPIETINTKVSGKVNLIFYMLHLFQIRFLVDKVKKTEKLSFVGP